MNSITFHAVGFCAMHKNEVKDLEVRHIDFHQNPPVVFRWLAGSIAGYIQVHVLKATVPILERCIFIVIRILLMRPECEIEEVWSIVEDDL